MGFRSTATLGCAGFSIVDNYGCVKVAKPAQPRVAVLLDGPELRGRGRAKIKDSSPWTRQRK
jgi:hypothetical protein